MPQLGRRGVTYEDFDDQGPELWGNYVGNWTHYTDQAFYNSTYTATPNPGASLSLKFSGSQAWIYGGVSNDTIGSDGNVIADSYPAASYLIDDVTSDPQTPYVDSDGRFVYFQTPGLPDGNHTIEIKVTTANDTNLFILDYITTIPSLTSGSQLETTPSTSAAARSTHAGAIVGGVIAGIAGIAFLIVVACYFLKKPRVRRAYYFENPSATDVLVSEALLDNAEPVSATTLPLSTGFSGTTLRPTHPDNNMNQPSNLVINQRATSSRPLQDERPALDEAGPTHVTGNTAEPRSGKAALIAQRLRDAQQPVQQHDSGIRFNRDGREEDNTPMPPSESPPSYTPN